MYFKLYKITELSLYDAETPQSINKLLNVGFLRFFLLQSIFKNFRNPI